ncbi:peptide transporter [Bisgaardia hudsonensis]|nr:peptide transporter [Bisgaardia hudsonensis]
MNQVFATEPSIEQIKGLEKLDAKQQQRQQDLLEQKVEQFSAKSEVQFDTPPSSDLVLPKEEPLCYPIKNIHIITHPSSPLSSFTVSQSSSSNLFINEHFSSHSTKVLNTITTEKSQFSWAYQEAAKSLGLILPYCFGGEGLNVLVKKMQNIIIESGYVTTRLVVGEQDLNSGRLILTVIPGIVRNTIIEDKSGVDKFTRLGAWTGIVPQKGDILNVRDIEQSLENLKRVPTADATINIVPPEGESEIGESDLHIQYAQRFPFRLSLGLDDAGSTSTGRWQGSATLSLDNIFTANDLFYTSFTHSLSRPNWAGEDDKGRRQSHNLSFYYSVPWHYWQLSASHTESKYHQEVAGAFGSTVLYSGESENSKLSLSRIVFRNNQHKTTLVGSLWARKSYNFIDDEEVGIQRKRTGGWEFGIQHKAYLGNMTLELGLNYKRGTGLNHAIPYPDEKFDEGSSRMKIVSANIQLTKPFEWANQGLVYRTSLQGQWSKTALVAQDRFSIGGRYTIRGTDGELSLSGEHGWVWRNEIAMNLGQTGQQVYVTFDKGQVKGKSTKDLIGTSLTGLSLGLKGGWKWFNYDVFVGTPLSVPEGFKTSDTVVGFNLGASF